MTQESGDQHSLTSKGQAGNLYTSILRIWIWVKTWGALSKCISTPNSGMGVLWPLAEKKRRNDTYCLFFQHLRGLLLLHCLTPIVSQLFFAGLLFQNLIVGVNRLLLGIHLVADVKVVGMNRADHEVEKSSNRDQPSLESSEESERAQNTFSSMCFQ